MLPIWLALLFIPLFAFCDREVGDGDKGFVSRSSAMAIGIIVGGILGYLTLGVPFCAIGAAWAAWRAIGFMHNSLAPATVADREWTAVRYSIQIVIAALAYWAHGPWLLFVACLMVSDVVDVSLRIAYGNMVAKARAIGGQLSGDFNATVEKATGAAFGAAIAGYALLSHLPG